MSKPVLAGKRDRKLNIAEMRNVNLLTADRESLTEIDSVVIDQKLSAGEKLGQLARQMNPYCYRRGHERGHTILYQEQSLKKVSKPLDKR